jgi:uncharacterized membrane protein
MKGPWTTALLIVSLGLNLFLIGAAVGAIVLGSRVAHWRGSLRPVPVLRAAATALQPPDRRAFLMTLRQVGRDARPTSLQARALKREVWLSLSDARFDAAAAKAKLREARTLDQSARTTIEEAVIDFAAKLPPGERAKFGAAVARQMPPGPPPTK